MASCTLHTLLGACGLPQHYAKLHAEEVDVDLLRDDILTLDDLAGLIPRADAEKILGAARGGAAQPRAADGPPRDAAADAAPRTPRRTGRRTPGKT
ncbi:ubiquitin-protein transferase [Aureococcus anophagefferens]|nr:ubiquitin-protein transferase [Aureococcus anophagefferens]